MNVIKLFFFGPVYGVHRPIFKAALTPTHAVKFDVTTEFAFGFE